MASKFCTQCGAEVAEGKKFCPRCGNPAVRSEAAGSATPAPANEVLSAPVRAVEELAAPGPSQHDRPDTVPPIEAAAAPDSPEPIIGLAQKTCTQCGNTILEGKRFCGKCGAPVSPPAEPVTQEPVETLPVVESPTIVPLAPEPIGGLSPCICATCGHAIPEGKRFCGKCGAPVVSIAETTAVVAASSVEPVVSSTPATGLEDLAEPKTQFAATPATDAPASESELPADLIAPNAFAAGASSELLQEAAELGAPSLVLPTEPLAVSVPASAPISVRTESAVRNPPGTVPWQTIGLISAAAVLVLALASGGFWLYHKHAIAAASSGRVSTTTTTMPANPTAQPATSSDSNALPATPATGATADSKQKPNAGKPVSGGGQSVPVVPAKPPVTAVAERQIVQPAPPPAVAHLSVPQIPAAHPQNDAKPSAPSPLASLPAPPTSGVLSYNGPPVPYGGVISFRNLRGGRLRFVYDHMSWQALVSRQPDGTQTLTLRSIKHADQSQCVVQWEVIP